MERGEERNAAIELRDSVLSRLERRGTQLVVTLAACVHRSAGRPGVDPGSAWKQTAVLLFRAGSAHGDVTRLPFEIAEGRVEFPGGVLLHLLPVPWPHVGTAELHLRDRRGERALLVGQGLTVQWSGLGERIEESAPPAAGDDPATAGNA